MKLDSRFPNFMRAMESVKRGTDTILISSDNSKIAYMMSLVILKNKLGEIFIELDKVNDGVVFSFSTYKGFSEKAKTSSEIIKYDLEIEEWINLISILMIEHNQSPRHQSFLLQFAEKRMGNTNNSGCFSSIAFFTLFIIFTVYNIVFL